MALTKRKKSLIIWILGLILAGFLFAMMVRKYYRKPEKIFKDPSTDSLKMQQSEKPLQNH